MIDNWKVQFRGKWKKTQRETTSTDAETTESELAPGLSSQSYLTDKDLVVVLVCILAQPLCHVGHPVS